MRLLGLRARNYTDFSTARKDAGHAGYPEPSSNTNMTSSAYSGDSLPLLGVKVLDLTRVLAGPLCTMMLGDLGADVIKIERPGSGDETRGWTTDTSGTVSPYFDSINRNKLSVAADLGRADDVELLRRLAAEADVVVDNFLPGTLERKGLDLADVQRASGRLVWCTITGFGAGNPRPGYDFVTQAECGWMAITGTPEGEPMKVGVALADVVAGKDAAIAILAALAARGPVRPRRIVMSLADSARASLVNVAQSALASDREPKRWGNAHANIVPYQLFHAADRPIVIAVGSDGQWTACARALGLDDLAADPSLRLNAGRLADRERVVTRVSETIRRQPADLWLSRLAEAGVPAGVVKGVLESVREAGGSIEFGMPSSVGGSWRRRPPTLDEHGARVRAHGWKAVDD